MIEDESSTGDPTEEIEALVVRTRGEMVDYQVIRVTSFSLAADSSSSLSALAPKVCAWMGTMTDAGRGDVADG